MSRRRACAILCAVIAATTLPSQETRAFELYRRAPGADPIVVDVTESLYLRYADDDFDKVTPSDKDNYAGGISKSHVNVRWRGLSAGLRVDAARYAGLPDCGPDADISGSDLCGIRNDARAEKVFAKWVGERHRIEVGDVYASLGRGLLLSIRKIDEIGIDTTLRGGAVDGRVGPVRLRALGGHTNTQNIDPPTQKLVEDAGDRVAGAEVEWAMPFGARLGARGVDVRYDASNALGGESRFRAAGGSVDWPAISDTSTNVYVEYVVSRATTELPGLADNVRPGHALYVQLGTRAGPATLLFEVKDYRRFDFVNPRNALFRYNEAPTLERADQENQSAGNASGARVKLDVSVAGGTSLVVNGVGYRYVEDGSDRDPNRAPQYRALHGYVGLEHRRSSGLSLVGSLGYRDERDLDKGASKRHLWQAEGALVMPLGAGDAIEVRHTHRTESKLRPIGGTRNEFVRGQGVIAWTRASLFTVSALFGYHTENPEIRTLYPGVEALWYARSWLQLKAFGGSTPGGLLCVSGICRVVPAFSGGKLDVVARF